MDLFGIGAFVLSRCRFNVRGGRYFLLPVQVRGTLSSSVIFLRAARQLTGEGLSIAGQWFDQDVAVEGTSDFWFSVASGMPTLTLQGQVEALSVSGESVNLDQVVFQVEAVGPGHCGRLVFQGLLSIQDEAFQLPRMHLGELMAAGVC